MNNDEQQQTPLFDPQLLGNMLGITDAQTLATFYDLFLQQAWPLLALLQAAAEPGHESALEKLAHKLKSSAHSVGAFPLSETLGQIEQLCRAGDDSGLASLLVQARPLAQQTLAAIHAEQIRLAAQSPD